MSEKQIYDDIGVGYAIQRRPDPRILSAITHALGDAETVVNVGAGSGSYEPPDRNVIAVEPALTMIRQRTPESAPVIQARAEHLPFADATFDAGLAVLTLHHWENLNQGLRELVRVVQGRIVILTYDPEFSGFWLVQDYFPEIHEIDRQSLPPIDEIRDFLGETNLYPVPIPHDCVDGFLGAYWRRPHMYLDERVRQAISAFSKIQDVASGVARLQRDLANGTWAQRYGRLFKESQLDLGYRLVVRSLSKRERE
ncbi:MAG: class I SAM-dependent methyltransferase [Dehalococcoidia bacterium]